MITERIENKNINLDNNIKSYKRCYLIDLENVQMNGLKGIEELSKNDEVIIFYSESVVKIPFGDIERFMHLNCKFKTVELIEKGKNYLDFQLVSYFGYLIGLDLFDEYLIVSKDNGMNIAIKNMRKFSSKETEMISSIEDSFIHKNIKNKELSTKNFKDKYKISKEIDDNNISIIKCIMRESSKKQKRKQKQDKIKEENIVSKFSKEKRNKFLKKFKNEKTYCKLKSKYNEINNNGLKIVKRSIGYQNIKNTIFENLSRTNYNDFKINIINNLSKNKSDLEKERINMDFNTIVLNNFLKEIYTDFENFIGK